MKPITPLEGIHIDSNSPYFLNKQKARIVFYLKIEQDIQKNTLPLHNIYQIPVFREYARNLHPNANPTYSYLELCQLET